MNRLTRNSHVKLILQEEPACIEEHEFAKMHADMQKCNLWLNAYEFMTHKTDFFNTEFLLMLQFEASVSTVASCCHLQVEPHRLSAASFSWPGIKAQGHVNSSRHHTGKTGNRHNIWGSMRANAQVVYSRDTSEQSCFKANKGGFHGSGPISSFFQSRN